MGIALPAPFASPPGHRAPLAQQPENGGGGGGGGAGGGGSSSAGGNIPEHLQVLKRLSAATSPNNAQNGQRPRVRTTVDDLAEKISATNFVLAGMLLRLQSGRARSGAAFKAAAKLPTHSLPHVPLLLHASGGPLEKYTNGGKGKPHKKFFRMLPYVPFYLLAIAVLPAHGHEI